MCLDKLQISNLHPGTIMLLASIAFLKVNQELLFVSRMRNSASPLNELS
jgi:hypothetical protein